MGDTDVVQFDARRQYRADTANGDTDIGISPAQPISQVSSDRIGRE